MASFRFLFIAGLVASAGLIFNDWLPTGVLEDVGSAGNTDRRDALRVLSIVLPAFAVFIVVCRRWIVQNVSNLIALSVSSALSIGLFVCVDIYLTKRAIVASAPERSIANVHVPDDLLGWRPGPGMVGRHEEDDSFSVQYEIDAAGFKAVNNGGTANSRIFLFGDSYTFGHGVSNDDTYANILADQLVPTIHVYNAGVMGYGVVQIFARFLELKDQLRSGDIVVFAPTSQDLKRNLQDFVFPAKLIFGERTEFGSRYPRYDNGEVRAEALVTPWNTAKALLFNGRWTKKLFRFVHSAIVSPSTSNQAKEMFESAATISQANSAKFLLVFLPQTKERLRNKYEEDISIFDYEDMMEYFPSTDRELAALRFKTDSHWNRQGHAIAAQALLSILIKRGFISPDDRKAQTVADPAKSPTSNAES